MSQNHSNGVPVNPTDLPTELTPEQIQIGDDLIWASTDPGLQQLYPDEYVAVHKRQVLAHGHDLLAVFEEAERVSGLPRDISTLWRS